MNVAAIGRRDLRLIPPAVLAWLGAGVAVGVRDAGPIMVVVAMAFWAGAVAAVVVAGRHRAWAPTVAVGLVSLALAISAVAASTDAREPQVLRAASAGGRSIPMAITITGRPTEGRVEGSVLAVDGAGGLSCPVLLFGTPGDPVVAHSRIGEVISVTGGLQRADPGEDVAFLVFARSTATRIAEPPPLLGAADGIRASFSELASGLPGPGAGLLPGLAIGDTSAVTPQLDAAMKASSLSHLTAVSGANCAIMVGLAFAAAAAIGMPRLTRVGVAVVALAGFVILVTPEPSVIRAAAMAGVALLSLVLSRPGRGIPLLCIAVIGLLVGDPWLARSFGFALSVLATAGLLVLAAPLARAFSRWLPRWLALLVAVPLAAQLACQPVLLMLDPSLPVYGVVANLLAEPAAPAGTVLGLSACLLAPVAPPLAGFAVWLAWIPATWIASVATFAASLPGARSPWPTGPVGIVLLSVLSVAALILLLRAGPSRVRAIARSVLVIAFAGYLATLAGTRIVTELSRPADWQFALCDVGQGDATVIRSGGAVALVDTGPEPAALTACLDELGVDRIQLLVLTHYDLDHVGGVDAVVGRVDHALIGPASDAGDAAIADALSAAGADVDQVATGEQGTLGELAWEVMWPPPRGVEPGNPASIVLEVRPAGPCAHGCLSGILLGDLGEESQQRLLGAARLGRVDVVKVAHHGSADQSAALYEALHATVGLIGVGAGNDYGHPTDALLGILAAVGTAAERTDLDGLVLVAPTGIDGELRVWTERPGAAVAPAG
ncbi:MAG: ComEC/Rec2 family competence protein [Pseudolysinimonas sp.]